MCLNLHPFWWWSLDFFHPQYRFDLPSNYFLEVHKYFEKSLKLTTGWVASRRVTNSVNGLGDPAWRHEILAIAESYRWGVTSVRRSLLLPSPFARGGTCFMAPSQDHSTCMLESHGQLLLVGQHRARMKHSFRNQASMTTSSWRSWRIPTRRAWQSAWPGRWWLLGVWMPDVSRPWALEQR